MREGAPSRPSVRAVSGIRSGSAKARRQTPAAAGPTPGSRTRIGDMPMMRAPRRSTASACPWAPLSTASVKAQLTAKGLRLDAARADLAQALRMIALGVAPAIRAGEQAMVAIGGRGQIEE